MPAITPSKKPIKDSGLVSFRLAKRRVFVWAELGGRRVDVIELQQLVRIYRKRVEFFWD